MTQPLVSLDEWLALCDQYGMPEVQQSQLETGTYTNEQIHEMVEGDRLFLEHLIKNQPSLNPTSNRSSISMAVDMDPIVQMHRNSVPDLQLPAIMTFIHRPSVAVACWIAFGKDFPDQAPEPSADIKANTPKDKVTGVMQFIMVHLKASIEQKA